MTALLGDATSEREGESELRELAERLTLRGYGVRRSEFFAPGGVMIFRRKRPLVPSAVDVLEGCVFLYRSEDGWCARVTQHGGRHWVKPVRDLLRLHDAALEALHATSSPPSEAWIETQLT